MLLLETLLKEKYPDLLLKEEKMFEVMKDLIPIVRDSPVALTHRHIPSADLDDFFRQ